MNLHSNLSEEYIYLHLLSKMKPVELVGEIKKGIWIRSYKFDSYQQFIKKLMHVSLCVHCVDN